MNAPGSRPLRIAEAARLLRIDRSFLYKLIKRRQVRAVKDEKGKLAIPEGELVRLAEERGYLVNLSPARDPIDFATELRAMGYSIDIDESALSEKARNLSILLSTVSGLAPTMLRNILLKYDRMPDLYDNNPSFLYADLVNAGLPWHKAMNVIIQFYHLTNPGALQGLFPFTSSPSPSPLIPFVPGAKVEEEEEEKEERKAQKRMERMMRFLLMAAMIKQLVGAPSQPSFMQFPPIPGAVYRPVLDKDGKPLRDEMGNIIYAMSFM